MSRKPRLDDIDSAKGLAIFLVVLGHLSGGEGANLGRGFDWYMAIDHAIYRFHMPFFMFLSGCVFFYAYKPVRSLSEYGRFIVRKLWRFLPAYLLFGIVMIGGKTLGQHVVHVDSPPQSFWKGFEEILIRPSHSHAATLWYIYCLLAFQLLLPIGLWLTRNRLTPLLVVAFPLHFIARSNPFLCADRICEHAFVFLVGAYVVTHLEKWTAFVDKYRDLTLALFLIILGVSFCWFVPSYPIALLSIPALHGLCRRPTWRTSSWLLEMGKYTFIIYLMNTIVIGFEKSLLMKFNLWTGVLFAFYCPLLALTGVYVPILFKVHIFRRIPFLDRITS